MSHVPITGDIHTILDNKDGLYEGNLWHYFKELLEAPNAHLPYHNVRHSLHVTWLCYLACKHYDKKLNKREVRNILIAALLHDYGHNGLRCYLGGPNDSANIRIAVQKMHRCLLPEDSKSGNAGTIETIIWETVFPHRLRRKDEEPLTHLIIKDADLAQALSPAWIQQVILGLASEWGETVETVLEQQPVFLKNIKFNTVWAKEQFPLSAIQSKIDEAKTMLRGIRSVT